MKSYKTNHEESENHERWLVSYADFITLLFAFFVVLYATSNSDLEKQKKFEKSIEKSLGTGAGKSGSQVIMSSQGNTHSQSTGQIGIESSAENKMVENEVEEIVERYLSKNKVTFEAIKNQFKIEYSPEGLVIRLKKENLFSPNSEEIKNESGVLLSFLGGLIRALDSKLVLTSYLEITDHKNESSSEKTLKQFQNISYVLNEKFLVPQDLISFSFQNRKYRTIDSESIHFIIKR